MSGSAASALEPTGWPDSANPSTTLPSRSSWRGESIPSESKNHLGLALADDPAAVLLGLGLDLRHAVGFIRDGRGDGDLLLGEAHAAELDLEALELPRLADRAGDLGHRPEAMEDAAGEPDRLGELLVDVDRVEVAGRARVAIRQVTVRGDLQIGDLGHRTMLVQVPGHTVSPFWFVERLSKTKNRSPPRSATSLTSTSVAISSPATTGGPHTNSWPPWTMREKSMPTSGSKSAGAIARPPNTTANIGGATTSAEPASRAASRSWWSGFSSPTAAANSRTFSRPTA